LAPVGAEQAPRTGQSGLDLVRNEQALVLLAQGLDLGGGGKEALRVKNWPSDQNLA